jgi:hypothetical protein
MKQITQLLPILGATFKHQNRQSISVLEIDSSPDQTGLLCFRRISTPFTSLPPSRVQHLPSEHLGILIIAGKSIWVEFGGCSPRIGLKNRLSDLCVLFLPKYPPIDLQWSTWSGSAWYAG